VEQAAERLGYHVVAADRLVHPGGGGVAILSRIPIEEVTLDEEHGCLLPRGQYVSGTVDGIQISSVYVTHDSASHHFAALSVLFARQVDRRAVIAGDMNIFRDGRDSWRFAKAIANRNKGRVEFGCDEIAMTWFRNQFKAGWVDVIGKHTRERPVYTYWNTTGHYERREGTRLDYILASPALSSEVEPQSVAISHEVRFGRHAQVSCEFREP
jgi:exonuclease III